MILIVSDAFEYFISENKDLTLGTVLCAPFAAPT